MPTIIDSLKVVLGLDTKDFDKGKAKVDSALADTGKKADKTGATLKKTGKDGAEGFDTVAKSALKFFAVLGGVTAIQQFIVSTVASSAALSRFAKNIGQDTATVSAWGQAVEQAGGSAEGLQASMEMLSMEQTKLLLTGQSHLIPFFSALGMGMSNSEQKAKDIADTFLEVSERFEKMNASRQTKFNMGRMFGIDAGTMNLLLKTRPEVETIVRRLKDHLALTKAQGEESERLAQKFTQSTQGFRAFGRELLSSATPAIEAFFSALQQVGDWMRENKEVVQTFLTIVAVGLLAIGAAAIPIKLTAVSILALAAAVALLWQDYQTFKRGGDSLIDWAKWKPGIDAAATGVRWLRGIVEDAFFRMFAAVDALTSLLKGDFAHAGWAAWKVLEGSGKRAGDVGASGPQVAPGAPSVGTSGPQGAAISYFQSKGWTREQAVGIVANLVKESNLNTGAIGDGGQAYGLAQWHPNRQADFAQFSGKSIRGSSFEDQLAFVHHELTAGKERGAGTALRGARSAADAARIVSEQYERPQDAQGDAARRAALAMQMMGGIPGASSAGQFGDVRAGSSTTAGNKSLSIGSVTINTQATDAPGIAADFGHSMNSLFTSQANPGLF